MDRAASRICKVSDSARAYIETATQFPALRGAMWDIRNASWDFTERSSCRAFRWWEVGVPLRVPDVFPADEELSQCSTTARQKRTSVLRSRSRLKRAAKVQI